MNTKKEEFSRTKALIGETALEKLAGSHVAVFGAGGVGGYVIEALARAGVGTLTIVDKDTVSLSNINRQIFALHSTVGKPKVEVAKERILDINPECKVNAVVCFYLPDTADQFNFNDYDYIVDAVDNVTAKLEIITRAEKSDTPVISAMGAGNKLDPTAFEITDIYKTSACPLARVMRRELKKRGIKKLNVVFSQETPIKTNLDCPASISFVPPSAGLTIAGKVVKDIINKE